MRRDVSLLFAFSFPLCAVAAIPDGERLAQVCRNQTDGVSYGIPEQLEACTKLVEGGTTGGQLASFLFLRGETRVFAELENGHDDKQWQLAVRDLSEAIQVAPRFTMAYYVRGVAYNLHGDYERAITDFSAASQLDPEWEAPKKQLDLAERGKAGTADVASVYASPHENSPLQTGEHVPANNLPDIHTFEQAQAICDALTEKSGFGPDQIGPDVRIAECTAIIDSGRLSGPTLGIALSSRSIGYTGLDDEARAIVDSREGARLAPENSMARMNYGVDLDATGNKKDAIAELDAAIRLKPDNETAYSDRASIEWDLGQWEASIGDIESALRYKPEKLDYLQFACVLEAVHGKDMGQAKARCSASLAISKAAKTWAARGLAELRSGDYASASADYREAALLEPKKAYFWYGYGLAQLGMKQDYGWALLQKANSLDPKARKTFDDLGMATPSAP